jgi:Phytanoyl-CoA dioxygenase (PhyH)
MNDSIALLDAEVTAPANPNAVHTFLHRLQVEGIVRLPRLVSDATLRDMQTAFGARLRHLRWNNADGYERTERWRFMVQDVLTLAQGFVDIALHPLVQTLLREYIGPGYTLCEAKGWRSLPTRYDFHGWHGDAWYDQTRVTGHVPREVKLALYLTDVRSGAFEYITGSHGKPPQHLSRDEVAALPLDRAQQMLGAAGTAFLFDSSGIHRQSIPICEPRQAIFYNYHDPAVPLQREDVAYYRYHPLLLNAAFLGGLGSEDYRVLGFGDKTTYQPDFTRRTQQPVFQALIERVHAARLYAGDWSARALAKALRALRLR